VKRLAGDYCCYQSELFEDDHARMEAALMNFLRVGVVIDGSSLSSGLEVSGACYCSAGGSLPGIP